MDENIEIWKIRNLIKKLSNMKGSGTSMVSLIIPVGAQLYLTNKMLTDEYGTASNIKSRVNRLSVLSAIVSSQQRLKLYKRTPKNGLVILCGTVLTDEGKERKITIDFEPFKPINKSLYLCDNKFHLEPLEDLLINDETYGFIIIDGNGTLFATISGNVKNILHSYSVDLPKKHGKGGQSALRFARLRLEARHNYLSKVNEMVKKYFTKNNVTTVAGLIIAGSADLKHKLVEADSFPKVLRKKIINFIDICYGGTNGLNQAIKLASGDLKDVKLINEKKKISKFFNEISKDTNKYCYGIKNVIHALEMGAVSNLLIWNELDLIRCILNDNTIDGKIIFIKPDEDRSIAFYDKNENIILDLRDEKLFIEWIIENHKKYGIGELNIITDKTQEGSQLCKGFGGLGCLLRWVVDFDIFENYSKSEDDYLDNFI